MVFVQSQEIIHRDLRTVESFEGLYGEKERIQNSPPFFVMVSSWYHDGRPRQVKPQVTLSYLESRYKLCSDLYSSIK